MRPWIALLLVVLWSSCAFDDAVPADALVRCASNSECPSGWRCSTLRGICQQQNESDTVAPVLTGSVSPALVRPGETIIVTLESNEPLSGQAVVEVGAGSTIRPVDAASDGTFAFTVPADEADELLTFYAAAEDRAGNGTTGVRLGTAVVDGTAPEVTSMRVSPSRVSPGQTAVVTVSLTEEVRAGVVLEASTSAGTSLLQLSSGSPSSLLRFELVVPPGTTDQTLSLRVSGLVDGAGNPGAETTGALDVDGTAPAIGALGLGGRRYSARPGFNVVSVPVSVSGATTISACLDQLCQSAADGQTVTFPVSGQEAEGPHTVVVRAGDDVGNLTQAADVVTFDFSAPRAQTLQVAPATVAPGGTVAVTASFDEVLALDTALQVSSDDGSWTTQFVAPASGGHLAAFDVRLPPATFSTGAFHLLLSGAADDVANAAADLDAGSFLLDVDPPVFLEADAGYAHRYSHQPGHDVVTVSSPPVSGAASVQVCLDADCRAFDGGVVSFAIGADAGEGSHALFFRAFDEVGNLATAFDVVTFDFTPPGLLSSNVRYVPPPGCPLLAVSALTRSAGVALEVTTDEPVAVVPVPDAGVLQLAIAQGSAGGQAFTYGATAPTTGLVTGTLEVTATLKDDVDNEALRSLGQIAVDTAPPPGLSPSQQDQFVYSRTPFGSATTAYAPRFTVAASPGVFEAGVRVELWSSPNVTTGLLMGTTKADNSGALPLLTLPPVDLPKLYFRAYDSACNVNPSIGVMPVPRMELTATLGNKVPGSAIPNPHRLVEEYQADLLSPALSASREWGANEVGQRGDGRSASTVSPALHWLGAGPSLGTVRCAWQDPVTESVYVLSDRAYRLEQGGFVDEGVLPGALLANCATVPVGTGRGLMAATTAGYMTRSGGRFVVEAQGYYYPYAPGSGWLTSTGSTLFSLDASPYGTTVWVKDGYYPSWTEVYVATPLPPRYIDRRNFTHYGFGFPLVVAAQSGGNQETWALQPGYTGSDFEWVRLTDAPVAPEAVQGFSASVVLVGGGAHPAWMLQIDGTWAPVAPCPIEGSIVASFESVRGNAVMVGADWSLAEFDGSTWTWLALPAPQLSGYRAFGHSPAVGTLATNGLDGGLLLHTAMADGGLDRTWTWSGNSWAISAGTTPASPSAVAVTAPDGTVYMLGLGLDAGMATFRHTAGAWLLLGGPQPLPARVDHRLVLDRSNRVLMIGGAMLPPSAQALRGYHQLSPTTGAWSDLGSSSAQWSQRARPAVGTDLSRSVTVVFGGTNGSPLQDTWEYGATGWQQANPADSPSARAGASLSYEPQRQLLVLTGGTATPDTWVYDGTWRDLTPWVGAPPASSLAAWDGKLGGVVSLGVSGDAVLAPTKVLVAERFVLTVTAQTGVQVLGGRVTANVTSAITPIAYSVWTNESWVNVGTAPTPFSLSAEQMTSVLTQGVRFIPSAPALTKFSVDYVEVSARYQVTN